MNRESLHYFLPFIHKTDCISRRNILKSNLQVDT